MRRPGRHVHELADLGSVRRDLSALASDERKVQMQRDREELDRLEEQEERDLENNRTPAPIHRFGSYDADTKMTKAQGTFLYMAPEMVGSFNYAKSVDAWSFGVMLIELFTLASPYPEEMPSYKIAQLVSMKRLRPRKLRRADLPHPGLLNVVEGCVRFRADTRLSFAVVEEQLKNQMEGGGGATAP